MSSVFQQALGTADFRRLHPKVRARFSASLEANLACIGNGAMARIWHGPGFTKPFLRLGASRHILFPEVGAGVPFTVENWPYLDRSGRETLSIIRTFELPRRRRRFDGTLVYDLAASRLIDYLGTHQNIAVDLELGVDERGGLTIRSTRQRLHLFAFGLPLPAPATGHAYVREWYDDEEEVFHINVGVTNPWCGPIFGYEGTFTVRYVDLRHLTTPASVKPSKEIMKQHVHN
jgi:hypothetical protein